MNMFRKFDVFEVIIVRGGGPLLRSGTIFYGPKTDVTGKTTKAENR